MNEHLYDIHLTSFICVLCVCSLSCPLFRLLTRYGSSRCSQVWSSINDIFVKTLLSVETHVSSNAARFGIARDQCFELYGFDILLDANLKPWLMEVRKQLTQKEKHK